MVYAQSTNSAIAQTYHESKEIIRQLAFKFRKFYGGDIDDLLGDSHIAFMNAYRTYDANKGACFLTWLHCIVWNYLLEQARRERRRQKNCSVRYQEAAMIDHIADKSFNAGKFLLDLSDDARFVAMLALEPEPGVRLELTNLRGYDFYRCLKKGVILYLKAMGWKQYRIEDSFQEVLDGLVSFE